LIEVALALGMKLAKCVSREVPKVVPWGESVCEKGLDQGVFVADE
jgi:hypothetical protein